MYISTCRTMDSKKMLNKCIVVYCLGNGNIPSKLLYIMHCHLPYATVRVHVGIGYTDVHNVTFDQRI